MGTPNGFSYTVRGDEVVITHRGKSAAVLRGVKAAAFLEQVERGDPQQLMARATGNYRRGNERMSKQHPRNAGRA
ncbi:hypothetical protein [Microbacterium halophytorum]|uniref:hypothetical protein n=1 Tax=Microbacterium halophytorum TaxID=2067568 RepID=UPI000CFD439F|nr:hypothetical protein [Microbacterium halophytorum]